MAYAFPNAPFRRGANHDHLKRQSMYYAHFRHFLRHPTVYRPANPQIKWQQDIHALKASIGRTLYKFHAYPMTIPHVPTLSREQ